MTLPVVAPRGRGLTVIFKGSNRCNAGCRFCSVGEAGGRTIAWEDFERVASEVEALAARRGAEHLRFTFHGGEPSLLGAPLIDRICSRMARAAPTVSFAMQSNLLVVQPDFVEVVARHGITLGTSLDPIAGERLDGGGHDAFPTWLRNYLDVARQVRAPGAIFVVTRRALGRAARLYEVALSIAAATGQRFGLQVNPVYAQGRAAVDGALHVTPEEFGDFMIELWQAWRRNPDPVRLTPILDFSEWFEAVDPVQPGLSCSFTGGCARHHVGIDYDLNVAGCGRRLDSRAWLGNLRRDGLVSILEGSDEPRRIEGRSERLRAGACADCRFFALCHGGCPDDAAIAGDLEGRFHWCAGYRRLFEAMEAARRDAAGPPRVGEPLRVLAVLEPGALRGRKAGALWLLPTLDGRALRFEAKLGEVARGWPGPKRIFVHNARVRSLALWEELLRRPETAVVLFEAEGLEGAVQSLNGLGASVVLDLPAILAEPGGGEAVERLVERFLREEAWDVRLLPFADLLLRSVRGEPAPSVGHLGLQPGGFRLEVSEEAVARLEPAAARIVRSVRAEESFTPTEWRARRPRCETCEHLAACGRRLAAGDGDGCDERLRRLAGRLAEAAAELKSLGAGGVRA